MALAGLYTGLAASFASGHLQTGACVILGVAIVWAWASPLRFWAWREVVSSEAPWSLELRCEGIEETQATWQIARSPARAPPLDPPPPEPPPNPGTRARKRKSPESQKEIVVGSVNVDGLTREKEIRLEELVLRRGFDIIVVQELHAAATWSPRATVCVPIFKRHTSPNMRGLYALVPPKHSGRTLNIETECIHVQAVLIQLSPMAVLIINVYCPPRDDVVARRVQTEVTRLQALYSSITFCILCGDFNLDMSDMRAKGQGRCREALAPLLMSFTVCSPRSKDHTSWSKGQLDSNIDFVLGSTRRGEPSCRSASSWESLGDHKLLTVAFAITEKTSSIKWSWKWNLSGFDADPEPFLADFRARAEKWKIQAAETKLKVCEEWCDQERELKDLWEGLLSCYREAARNHCKPIRYRKTGPSAPKWVRGAQNAVEAAREGAGRPEAAVTRKLQEHSDEVWFASRSDSKDQVWSLINFLRERSENLSRKKSQLTLQDLVPFHKAKFAKLAQTANPAVQEWYDDVERAVDNAAWRAGPLVRKWQHLVVGKGRGVPAVLVSKGVFEPPAGIPRLPKMERAAQYAEYIATRPDLIAMARTGLKGKILAADTVGLSHAHVLAEIANETIPFQRGAVDKDIAEVWTKYSSGETAFQPIPRNEHTLRRKARARAGKSS